jgi:hypothetical protein
MVRLPSSEDMQERPERRTSHFARRSFLHSQYRDEGKYDFNRDFLRIDIGEPKKLSFRSAHMLPAKAAFGPRVASVIRGCIAQVWPRAGLVSQWLRVIVPYGYCRWRNIATWATSDSIHCAANFLLLCLW